MSKRQQTILVITILLLGTALVLSNRAAAPLPEAPAPIDKRPEAFVMTKRFVKDRLKSPDAAEFPGYGSDEVYVTRVGEDLYDVSAFVICPNAFNVKVKIHYQARMRDKGDGKTWQCASLTMYP